MTTGIAAIDHLMISVEDSQQAGALFERLGFTATPRSLMPGLSNRLVCFPAQQPDACNYIELMALEDADRAPQPMPQLLPPAGRPVSMVTVAPDIDATYRALREYGLRMPEPIHLERDWDLPGGEVITPRFAVLIPDIGQSPFFWNVCQHKTPQHYVRPDFVDHPNGATGLKAIIAVADDPAHVAAHYRTVWGAEVDGRDPVRVTIGAVDLRIFTASELEAAYRDLASFEGGNRLVGFAIACRDLERTTAFLADRGFSPRRGRNGAYLDPAAAQGNLLVFEPADA